MNEHRWRIRFLDSGYCWQLGWLAARKRLGPCKFHAIFLLIEHPQHGRYLIDCGYGPRFMDATRSFPQRFYRWLTPVKFSLAGTPSQILADSGVDLKELTGVFISHFHADHIGGAHCFDGIPFIYRRDSLEHLRNHSRLEQVRHGFLSELLPESSIEIGRTLTSGDFSATNRSVADGMLSDFVSCDYFGDGSLLLVDLPGHADGHMGFWIRSDRDVFYIVDACWDVPAMLAGRQVPFPSRRFQRDWNAYRATQSKLRSLHQNRTDQVSSGDRDDVPAMIACHCLETLPYVS